MANHAVIAGGQFTVTLIHPLWNGGTPTTLDGFKLEGQVVQAQQLLPSSKLVALTNGGSIIITNNNNSGTITFNVTKTGQSGDMATIANFLRTVGDSIGGIIRVTQELNGKTDGNTFAPCTVQQAPPLVINGNDAADYQVVWAYGNVTPM
jgi:hypothetical protein